MPQELKIAMLGASGVGKTSLLTAMYEQFESTVGQTNLQLTPDLKSSAILAQRLGELKSLLDDFEAKGGIGTNVEPRSFFFDLGNKGKKPSLRLQFQDFPGEYLDAESRSEDKKFVQDMLTESVAVIIAIDAPALMEKDGKWHDYINRPQQIKNLFATVYQNMKSPRLVIFAPVRCEKYMQNMTSTTALLRRVKEGYSNLLNLFGSDALLPWVVNVVTPVQTVGTVVFSRIEVIDRKPHFYFHKISHDADYRPQDSEQPLGYILRFALRLQIEDRNRDWGPYSFFRDKFGWDDHIKQAARQAADGCKSTSGFTVLQGEKWLNIR